MSPHLAQLAAATAHLEPPYGVVDLDAFDANAADLVRRAGGTPIRVASKSVRCRALLSRALAMPGFAGVLAFTLPEALWLAEEIDDVVVGYPTTDRSALRALASSPSLATRVTLMVDCVEHLDLAVAALAEARSSSAAGDVAEEIRVCLDLDASLRLLGGRIHLGVRRSPVHDAASARALALEVARRPGLRLVGLMAYEAQVAGVGDAAGRPVHDRAVRAMQAASRRDVASRRAAAVAAVREVAELEFVNAGGTGSIESSTAESVVTEVAAGSGLYAPLLFDAYRAFTLAPAAFFVLSVVRRSPGFATCLGGGWVASGVPGADRLPAPVWPAGLSLTSLEAAGEVQTPLSGPGVDGLSVGDHVWFRPAKAGEFCERLDTLHLVSGDAVVDAVPTYRGEGRTHV